MLRVKPLKHQGALQTSRLKRSRLKRVGPKSLEWQKFRNEKASRDKDEEGIIKCQDFRINLPRCGVGLPDMDLHHIQGRDARPSLYFEESNLVWLTRSCHNDAHN